MPDITLPLAMLKKPLEIMGNLASNATKEKINKIKAEKNLKAIYQKLNSTQKVKTIWNVDRAISISSFYYPASIQTSENITQKITSLDDLPSNAIVLEGTAGQGKSILLRWLLGREIRSGNRLPLFIELRKIGNESLRDYIISAFCDLLDIPPSIELFREFAHHGKISILLDGYDEVDPENIASVTANIGSFTEKFPEARVVVTSRPKSGIENSPYFDVIPIAKLEKGDFASFFEKILGKDKILAKRLCSAIEKSTLSIDSLISTPLLATLLTIVYRAHQKIPADFAEFYDELFQILLVRHDRSKPGYERKRKTSLSDREMQQVFEAFCYKTKANRLSSIPRQKALEIASESISAVGCACNESHFISDIKSVTCLLSEEGSQLDFLHQSVQEFFAARYISTRPDAVSKRFYTACIDGKWGQWQQELKFLSRIDVYRSSRDFFIPSIDRFLSQFFSPNENHQERLKIAREIGVRQRITTTGEPPQSTIKYYVYDNLSPVYYGSSVFADRIFNALFGRQKKIPWQSSCFDSKTDGQRVSYEKIALDCNVMPELLDAIEEAHIAICQTKDQYKETMAAQDRSAEFMDL